MSVTKGPCQSQGGHVSHKGAVSVTRWPCQSQGGHVSHKVAMSVTRWPCQSQGGHVSHEADASQSEGGPCRSQLDPGNVKIGMKQKIRTRKAYPLQWQDMPCHPCFVKQLMAPSECNSQPTLSELASTNGEPSSRRTWLTATGLAPERSRSCAARTWPHFAATCSAVLPRCTCRQAASQTASRVSACSTRNNPSGRPA
jgi:hypothetical protein